MFTLAEEEQKRGQIGYGQIGFNYDQASTSSNQNTEESKEDDDDKKDDVPDEPYVPNPRFYIPPDMELVRTLFYWNSLAKLWAMLNGLKLIAFSSQIVSPNQRKHSPS